MTDCQLSQIETEHALKQTVQAIEQEIADMGHAFMQIQAERDFHQARAEIFRGALERVHEHINALPEPIRLTVLEALR